MSETILLNPSISEALVEQEQGTGGRVAMAPDVMAGKPIIKGTRIPVELIVRMLAHGASEAEILGEYPRLGVEDIRAGLAYAALVLANEAVFPLMAKR